MKPLHRLGHSIVLKAILTTIALAACAGCAMTPPLKHDGTVLGRSELSKVINLHFHSDERFLKTAIMQLLTSPPHKPGATRFDDLRALGFECFEEHKICNYGVAVPYALVMPDGSILPKNRRVKIIGAFVDMWPAPENIFVHIDDMREDERGCKPAPDSAAAIQATCATTDRLQQSTGKSQ